MSAAGNGLRAPGAGAGSGSSMSSTRPTPIRAGQIKEGAQPTASGSKQTPTQRTLKQPMTLRVSESSPGPGSGGAQDKDEYHQALKRKAELSRRVDKWMDKLMEEPVDRQQFQRALSYMHAGQYGEVEHERHLNGLCSYPLCANKPSAPYRAHKRFQISARAKTIKEVEGNADEGFCSKRCRIKSQWVRENLGREAAWLRGKVAPLELLEDMEERGELVWEGGKNGQYKRIKPAASSDNATHTDTSNNVDKEVEQGGTLSYPPAVSGTEISAHDHAPRGDASGADSAALPHDSQAGVKKVSGSQEAVSASSRLAGASQRPAALDLGPRHAPSTTTAAGSGASAGAGSRTIGTQGQGTAGTDTTSSGATEVSATLGSGAGTSDPPSPTASEVDELLASLEIRERDTQGDVPVPPSLNPPPQAILKPKPPSAVSARKARNTSSMIDGGKSKLAQSVLTAHRQMRPVLQDEGDSGDDEGYEEEEWEREMGWGGGEELDAMFEEARKARELAE